jgi:hypothetical protein
MSIILDGTSGINTPNTFAYKNLLIDAGFTINQRGYVSAATLASGAYGHDRWKAGASGGNYSFTQLASNTQITIASGKSLIQVVEDKNVSGTSYVLSWEGTAQARYAVNSATPAGSYAASPIVITGQTAGTTMSVEFNTGTLSKPQLELGAVATSFDQRAYSQELAMCQRYYEVLINTTETAPFLSTYYRAAVYSASWFFKQSKRATPTIALGATAVWNGSTPSSIAPSIDIVYLQNATTFFPSSAADTIALSASAEL